MFTSPSDRAKARGGNASPSWTPSARRKKLAPRAISLALGLALAFVLPSRDALADARYDLMFSELSADLDLTVRVTADRLVAEVLTKTMLSLSHRHDRVLAMRGADDLRQSVDMRLARPTPPPANSAVLIATQP